MIWRHLVLIAALAYPALMTAQSPDKKLSHHAAGTFEVDVRPLTPVPAPGIYRYSINKHVHGDLEATTQGEMFGGGDFKTGNAGYVGIEEVTGNLGGKSGTFVLQHFATMEDGAPHMQVAIAPGSGTGGLIGIRGVFTIIIDGGKHSYTLDYSLSADQK